MPSPITVYKLLTHPKLWRFTGFVSTIVGFSCYALSSSFEDLFGKWNQLKIAIYTVVTLLFCLLMLFVNKWKGLARTFLAKTLVGFLVLMLTSLYSFFEDRSEERTKKNSYGNILSLISCGAFALVSMSLSRQLELEFEVGMFNFFLGCFLLTVMKMNFKLAPVAAIFCYLLVNSRSCSDYLLKILGLERGLADIESGANTEANRIVVSRSSSADDGNDLKHKLKELEISLLGPESASPMAEWNWDLIAEMIPMLNVEGVLITCAQAMSDGDIPRAISWIDKILVKMVLVSGEPLQRLGAYMLEGLRARLESSGSMIYKALKSEQYMSFLYQICPYLKFAYTSANVVIAEAMENESRIHIIDFQIAQGTQWMLLMKVLAQRPSGPPFIRVTGIDYSQSFLARGGGLDLVGQRLSDYANSLGIPFEFHRVAMSGCEVQRENLGVEPGEALAVNFTYGLHRMPDESASTVNHRDRLLRLVKSLSPKVVTLVEQESNTNTSPFFDRFLETMGYYTAMFESIDVARPRNDKQRISAEQHCVARDIVNMIACEGADRVERHELLEKWRSRFTIAGFTPWPLSSSVTAAVSDLLSKEYHQNYWTQPRDGALYLGWRSRDMCTSSAWW